MEWFLAVGMCFVVIALWAGVSEGEREAERRRLRLEANKLRSVMLRRFLEQEKATWPYSSGVYGDTTFMMMDVTSSQLRFISGLSEDATLEVKPHKEHVLSISDVINVELKQDTETIVNVDLKTSSQKQGSLSRAAVGGLVFGGAGAVVGASSAGSKGTTKGSHTSTTRITGNRLVIGTMDPSLPTITQKFHSSESAVDWYHRVMGAVARQST